MKKPTFRKILQEFCSFIGFFLMVGFVVTCCMMLFLKVLSTEMGLTYTAENVADAAKITLLNVVVITVIFKLVDYLRRKWTLERPVRKIKEATEKMVKGDFSVRVEPVSRLVADDTLGEVIESINVMAEELSGVETLRTDFIANVSHEMKTPLAVIRNYGTLLAEPNLPEEKRMEYAGAITDASQRLADMVTNILKLNRLENQQIYPQITRYNLGEQLCESLLQYESTWEKKGITIETEIEEEVFVSADAELLLLVWNNLFSNAFKFTDEGGRVAITLISEGEYATVKVADTGCGISAEVGAHVFEKFYQGDTSHRTQGNGLGLALVKRVIDIMQGEIAVESAVGVGTTFTVKIRRERNEVEKNR